MTTALALDKEKLHATVARFISERVKNFQLRFGGDWWELLSEANLAYAHAAKSYDPAYRTKFVTWVGRCIFDRFQEVLRQRGKAAARQTVYVEDLENNTPDRRRFDLDAAAREVSADAGTIINYVMTTDEARNGQRCLTAKSWRARIVEHFCDLGWAAGRVLEAFGEIREILK